MPFIHFNSIEHRKNKRDGGDRKTFVYRKTKSAKAVKCRDIVLKNVSGSFFYRPDKPLKCGAVAWIEVEDGDIELVDPDATE